MRSMATAIETYLVDHDVYPPCDPNNNLFTKAATQTASSTQISGAPGTADQKIYTFTGPQLTTPIAYMTSYFPDEFASQNLTYSYYTAVAKDESGQPVSGWILLSPGPDGKYNIDPKIYDPSKAQPTDEIIAQMYNATNGTISAGDIVRVKQ